MGSSDKRDNATKALSPLLDVHSFWEKEKMEKIEQEGEYYAEYPTRRQTGGDPRHRQF